MAIVVSCRCGQRFAAKRHLAGRKVSCPSCGGSLSVPAASHTPEPGIYFTCECGRAFLAPDSMRGEQARCRGCGRVVHVPHESHYPDPLGIAPLSSTPGFHEPLATLPPADGVESEIPWKTLKKMGMIGGGVLLALIVVTTVRNNWHRRPKVEHIAKIVAAAPKLFKPPAAPGPNAPSGADSGGAAGESTGSATSSAGTLPIPPGTLVIRAEATRVAISPNGKLLLAIASDGARLWDISQSEAREVGQLPSFETGVFKTVQAAAFGPDSETLALAFSDGCALVKAPDLQTQRIRIPEIVGGRQVRFSGDGKKLLSAFVTECLVFDIATQKRMTSLPTASFTFDSLGVEPDVSRAWIASTTGILRYDVAMSQLMIHHRFESGTDAYKFVGISYDGRWVAGFAEDRIDLWDVLQKRKNSTWAISAPGAAFFSAPRVTCDGRFVIARDWTKIYVWDAIQRKEVARWDMSGHSLSEFVLAEEGRRVAACESGSEKEIRVFLLPTGE